MADDQSLEKSEFTQAILSRADNLATSSPCGLIEGYSAMAKDAARERKAKEWSEGLIGEASAET